MQVSILWCEGVSGGSSWNLITKKLTGARSKGLCDLHRHLRLLVISKSHEVEGRDQRHWKDFFK